MALDSDYRRREESITYAAEPAGQGETHELLTRSTSGPTIRPPTACCD